MRIKVSWMEMSRGNGSLDILSLDYSSVGLLSVLS